MSTARRLRLVSCAMASLAAAGIAAAQERGERASLNPLAAIPKATLKGFVDQPLFDPSRRPPAVAAPVVMEAPAPPPPTAEPPPSLHLLGIVQGAKSAAAIVHRDDSGKTETLHTGDHVGGWEVEVLPLGLRVRSGDRAFDYKMFKSGSAAAPEEAPGDAIAPTVAAARAARLARPDE